MPYYLEESSRIKTRAATSVALALSFLPPFALEWCLQQIMCSAKPSTFNEVSSARASVCAVSKRCRGRGCLQRSIAVVIFCRLSGTTPSWKSGYRLDPFRAHAWVEVGGVPVGEPSDVTYYARVLEANPMLTQGRKC
ncbi:lasso peptide biosynthesis B2 protein [Actinomyces wuliandei]|uniref:lasso peptide biosynthesis B2 protein n=1 Tax=Actinomyces wuliandei TaxID=2057743 RepID=UPI003C12C1AE